MQFEKKELLEEMIHDRFVCGVNHPGIQRKLLSEGDLIYNDAIKLAQTIEASERDYKKLGGGSTGGPAPAKILNYTTPFKNSKESTSVLPLWRSAFGQQVQVH